MPVRRNLTTALGRRCLYSIRLASSIVASRLLDGFSDDHSHCPFATGTTRSLVANAGLRGQFSFVNANRCATVAKARRKMSAAAQLSDSHSVILWHYLHSAV